MDAHPGTFVQLICEMVTLALASGGIVLQNELSISTYAIDGVNVTIVHWLPLTDRTHVTEVTTNCLSQFCDFFVVISIITNTNFYHYGSTISTENYTPYNHRTWKPYSGAVFMFVFHIGQVSAILVAMPVGCGTCSGLHHLSILDSCSLIQSLFYY